MNYIKTKKQKFLVFILFGLLTMGVFLFGNFNFSNFDLEEVPRVMAYGVNGETEDDKFNDTFGTSIANSVNSEEVLAPIPPGDEICPGMSWSSPISSVFNCFLLIILRFLGLVLAVAATLFNWIIDPENMKAVIANDVIYRTWAMVRDTLNVAFILVLLFSAFSTIFQVDKYSYKKLLLTLVLMALLVNFSYPIARFIIDFANSLMYYLLNTLGLGNFNSVFTDIAKESALGKIIYSDASADTSYLLASVLFMWVFAITILVIAGLFVIRTVALALLIIFSSLAFTGAIIPFMSKYSSQWWDALFKYAFFGPVMVFMLMVATKMMESINTEGMGKMKEIAGQQSADPGIIAAMSFFIIPIIILWAGIIFAQQMSLMGASAVIGRGQKVALWGAKQFSGYNFGKSQYDAFASSRKKRRDAIQGGRFMGKVGDNLNKWQDSAIGAIPLVGGSAQKRADNMRKVEAAKGVREKAADLKGTNIEDLSVVVNNSFNDDGTINEANINKTSAGSAQAFMDKNADDRKTFVEDALQTKGGTKAAGIVGSGFEKILGNAPANSAISAAIDTVIAGPTDAAGKATPGYQDALRKVTSHINRQSEKVVNEFTK